MIINNKQIRTQLVLNVYRVILDLTFGCLASNYYAQTQFATEYYISEPNVYKIFISYVLMNICYIFVPFKLKKLSSYVVQMLFLLVFIPLFSVYGIMDLSTEFMIYIFVSLLFLIFALKVIKEFKFPIIKLNKNIIKVFLYLIVIYSMVKMYQLRGIHFEALDLGQIYKFRENMEYSSSLVGYTWTWSYTIFIPFLMYIAYIENRKIELIGTFIIQILMYFITPYKTILFGPILIFLVSFLMKTYTNEKYSFVYKFCNFLIFVLLLGVFLYVLFGEGEIMFLSSHRILDGPAYLKFKHFNVFSELPKLFYSEGIVGKIFGIPYPYNQPSGFLVAASTGVYSNENAGYLATAYDNLGFIGMLVMNGLLAVVLKFFDSLTNENNYYIIMSLSLYQFYILNDGDLLTCLNGGIIPLFILIYIFNLSTDKTNKKERGK